MLLYTLQSYKSTSNSIHIVDAQPTKVREINANVCPDIAYPPELDTNIVIPNIQ